MVVSKARKCGKYFVPYQKDTDFREMREVEHIMGIIRNPSIE